MNTVNNAIGTQRQFQVRPENVYQKRLITPNFSTGIDTKSNNYNATALVASLGVLGNNMLQYQNDEFTRSEKVAGFVDKVVSGTATDEDKHKLDSIQLIAKYAPNYMTADNPYAVHAVEASRGKLLRQEINNEFNLAPIDTNQTQEERIKAYEEFVGKKQAEIKANGTADNLAFDLGFTANHMSDVVDVSSTFTKAKSRDLIVRGLSVSTANLDNLAKQAPDISVDELKKQGQGILDTLSLINGISTQQKYAVIEAGLTSIAKATGDITKVRAFAELIGDIDEKGNKKKISELIPTSTIEQTANIRQNVTRQGKIDEFTAMFMGAKSADEVHSKYKELWDNPQTRPIAEALSGRIEGFASRADSMRKQQEALKLKQVASESNKGSLYNSLNAQIEAKLANTPTDRFGRPTGSVYYNSVDSNGNVSLKRATTEELTPAIQQIISGITNDSKLSVEDKAHKTLRVLAFDGSKTIVNAWKDSLGISLNSLNPKDMKVDESGKAVLPAQLQQAIHMRALGASEFENVFGREMTSTIDALRIAEETGTLASFAQGVEVLKNPQVAEKIKQQVNNAVNSLGDVKLNNMYGDSEILTSTSLIERTEHIKTGSTHLTASGVPAEDAVKMVTKKFAENYVTYGGTAIPKGIFVGVPYELDHIGSGLDFYKEHYRSTNGLTADTPVYVRWNSTTKTLDFSGGVTAPTSSLDVKGIINQGQVSYNATKAQEAKNFNVNTPTTLSEKEQ